MRAARPRRHLATAAVAATVALARSAAPTPATARPARFTPHTPNTLTVATAQIPDPGFWTGTFAHPTGGFEYGLAEQLAARFGLAKIKVVYVPFHELVRGHLGGADLALSDITITEERAEHLDFSTPYLKAPPAIVVRPGTEVAGRQRRARPALGGAERHDAEASAGRADRTDDEDARVRAPERNAARRCADGRVDAVLLDLPVALAYARESPRKYARRRAAAQRSGARRGAAVGL